MSKFTEIKNLKKIRYKNDRNSTFVIALLDLFLQTSAANVKNTRFAFLYAIFWLWKARTKWRWRSRGPFFKVLSFKFYNNCNHSPSYTSEKIDCKIFQFSGLNIFLKTLLFSSAIENNFLGCYTLYWGK